MCDTWSMPKKSTTPNSGRLNFRISPKLHNRLFQYMHEEGHNDISETCRFLLQQAMIERYGSPTLIYRENTPTLRVADAPSQIAP